MPDRLPSLIALVGFWVPPALAGWAAARSVQRKSRRDRSAATAVMLAAFVLTYAVAWFLFNHAAIPPYIPGATMDPRFVPPGGTRWLALFTGAIVLPGSALACRLAWRTARRGHGKSHGDRGRLLQEQ